MNSMRKSGILAHVTSLPNEFGIGDLGKSAYDFVDFLQKSGQSYWQILPLNPTGYGNSPYQSISCFAGNTLLISPEILKNQGYVSSEDTENVESEEFIDYEKVYEFKQSLFEKAYKNFANMKNQKLKAAYRDFCEKNKYWLDDYALFLAAKRYFCEMRKFSKDSAEYLLYMEETENYIGENSREDYYFGGVWQTWPKDIRSNSVEGRKKYESLLSEEIEFNKFLQFEFFRQWGELKEYANSKNIEIIGDLPIFVSMDSVDMWAEPENFLADSKGFPKSVAGVPPDYFSETGQLWGNPLYNWPVHEKSGFCWWGKRIKAMLEIVDIIRIDHFRGFESYWEIPYGEENAVKGKWVKGPGIKFFKALEKNLGNLPIIAEDLGIITPEVEALRKKSGFPGMKVLQFAFDSHNENTYLPHNFDSSDIVLYTGTHDNDTTLGWYENTSEKTADYVRRLLNISGEDISWDMIRFAYASTAKTVIFPIQDILSLNSQFRMNTPGKTNGNWAFRMERDCLNDSTAQGLRYFNLLFNRNKEQEEISPIAGEINGK